MSNRATIVAALAVAGCAAALAATPPGAFSEGSTTGGNGWKFSYSAVAQPPLGSGQHIKIQTDASHTDGAGRPTVFHRFFTDSGTRTYFGYDLVVEPVGQANSAVVKFQPLSLHADQLPKKYASTAFKAVGLPRFPAETFKSGQTIAVDVLQNPTSGQKVVDYIQVAFVPAADMKPAGRDGAAVAAQVDPEKAKGMGNPSAPVRMEIFSDFECPGCKAFHETVLPMLVRDYVSTGKLYIVSREFPLPMHPYSREAANYATAAAQVGKYQQVADALFAAQASWNTSGKVLDVVATVLTEAERKKVQQLAAAPATLAQVQQDVDSGMAQRVNQTPTVMVSRGAKRYPYAGPSVDNYPLLRSLIEGLLK